MTMIGFLKRLFGGPRPAGKLHPECLAIVTVNDHEVCCQHPKEVLQRVEWSDLREVAIVTNDQGPWFADVFWHLVGGQSECFFPQGATNEDALITALQALPSFDNEQMIAAMTCTENRRFVCWQKDKGEQGNQADGQ